MCFEGTGGQGRKKKATQYRMFVEIQFVFVLFVSLDFHNAKLTHYQPLDIPSLPTERMASLPP